MARTRTRMGDGKYEETRWLGAPCCFLLDAARCCAPRCCRTTDPPFASVCPVCALSSSSLCFPFPSHLSFCAGLVDGSGIRDSGIGWCRLPAVPVALGEGRGADLYSVDRHYKNLYRCVAAATDARALPSPHACSEQPCPIFLSPHSLPASKAKESKGKASKAKERQGKARKGKERKEAKGEKETRRARAAFSWKPSAYSTQRPSRQGRIQQHTHRLGTRRARCCLPCRPAWPHRPTTSRWHPPCPRSLSAASRTQRRSCSRRQRACTTSRMSTTGSMTGPSSRGRSTTSDMWSPSRQTSRSRSSTIWTSRVRAVDSFVYMRNASLRVQAKADGSCDCLAGLPACRPGMARCSQPRAEKRPAGPRLLRGV